MCMKIMQLRVHVHAHVHVFIYTGTCTCSTLYSTIKTVLWPVLSSLLESVWLHHTSRVTNITHFQYNV